MASAFAKATADKPSAFLALCRAHVLTRTLRAPSHLRRATFAEVATEAGSGDVGRERLRLSFDRLRTGLSAPSFGVGSGQVLNIPSCSWRFIR